MLETDCSLKKKNVYTQVYSYTDDDDDDGDERWYGVLECALPRMWLAPSHCVYAIFCLLVTSAENVDDSANLVLAAVRSI